MISFTNNDIQTIEEYVSNWSDEKTSRRVSEELIELSLNLLHYVRGKEGSQNVLDGIADAAIALKYLEIRFNSEELNNIFRIKMDKVAQLEPSMP